MDSIQLSYSFWGIIGGWLVLYDFIITCYRFFTNFRVIYCSLNNFNYLSVLIVSNNIYPTTIFIKKHARPKSGGVNTHLCEIIYLRAFVYPEKPINKEFVYDSVAYVLYAVGCPHISRTTHYFDKERTTTMKIYFAYYNQYKNGIDIAFDDNVLLFVSCT